MKYLTWKEIWVVAINAINCSAERITCYKIKKEPLKRNIQKCLAVTDEIWHWWNMSLYVQSLSKYIGNWRSTSVFYYFFRYHSKTGTFGSSLETGL